MQGVGDGRKHGRTARTTERRLHSGWNRKEDQRPAFGKSGRGSGTVLCGLAFTRFPARKAAEDFSSGRFG